MKWGGERCVYEAVVALVAAGGCDFRRIAQRKSDNTCAHYKAPAPVPHSATRPELSKNTPLPPSDTHLRLRELHLTRDLSHREARTRFVCRAGAR